jgi:hypothetical protein
VSSRDNGSSGEGALDELDGQVEYSVSDVERTKHAKEVLQAKITKTMDNIMVTMLYFLPVTLLKVALNTNKTGHHILCYN